LLNTIALNKDQNFCIKKFVGKPTPYKSYKCPFNYKIYPDEPNVCIKDCPHNLVKGKEFCEAQCRKGYFKEYDLCVDKENKKSYKPEFSPLEKADPVCLNGYFSQGLCYSCLGHSEHSNGQCLTPCHEGAPSDNFCSFDDQANRYLSLIDDFWAKFFRNFFDNVFLKVIKSEVVSKDRFKDLNTLKEISSYIRNNKDDIEIQKISGKFMIFLRDKFRINLDDDWKNYMKSIFYKLLLRYEKNIDTANTNDVLNVVNDIVFFKGDYTDPYLENKIYGRESLPLTVANILDHMC